ncbi:TAXI family TRAP transporter solute-binding subunit [Roseicella aerolata]|uniref:TRAP transporter substrate-binding protein n=1 Tax=Roseicella aerolata TaxID=2883479 RepID=A0A9X1L9Q6_9PROT|nr:TAXI family TRAP transporter solute-binding subunit [Roseicella aerolata]MCB4824004.1 TRAP transporter substrate-binding protein [Roseicella aerolata]
MNRRSLLAGLVTGLACPALARAQAIPNSAAAANANVLGVISGGLDGTYTRFAADLAAVLDGVDGLRILPIIGKGSLQNLSDLLYLRGVDLAIVQSDVLAAAAQQRVFPRIEQQVQYVTKLYDEEVHVFARPGIEQLSDLGGQLVSMDNPGSGTAMTATLLFSRLGIPVQPVYAATVDATEKLRRGEIAAMVRVTGKPARFTTPLPEGARLLSVPLSEALLETYLPASFTAADYPAVIPAGETVETIAVGAVLAAFNHQNADRRDRLMRFARALSLKFESFMRPPRHPKWREVNLEAGVPGWTKFGAEPARQAPRRPRRGPEGTEQG